MTQVTSYGARASGRRGEGIDYTYYITSTDTAKGVGSCYLTTAALGSDISRAKRSFGWDISFSCCCGVTLASPLLIFCCLLEASLVFFSLRKSGRALFFIFAACLSTP
jgi:hypothetical protein